MMAQQQDALPFVKYEGAGNDFVCVDDREAVFGALETQATIARICDRHFGVGADGLILLRERTSGGGLEMVYYNSDGAPSSFCGNGARCFARFAADLGIPGQPVQPAVEPVQPAVEPVQPAVEPELVAGDGAGRPIRQYSFAASDGPHAAFVLDDGRVRVSMRVAGAVERIGAAADLVQTGSPHYVAWGAVLPEGDIRERARVVRYGPRFAAEGVNVNFVVDDPVGAGGPRLRLRTYERGVEDETLACGTGVTAAALSFAERRDLRGRQRVHVLALGGALAVAFYRGTDGAISEVWLEGPARRVFAGQWPI